MVKRMGNHQPVYMLDFSPHGSTLVGWEKGENHNHL